MKQIITTLIIFSFSLLTFKKVMASKNSDGGWKAGVATALVTPDKPMLMGGFAFRKKPSEGNLTELYVRALALEDAKGNQAVFVTFDLAGIRQEFSDQLRDRLQEKYHLSRAQIVLNVSHTHSGPALFSPRSDSTSVLGKRAKEYTEQLANHVVEIVGVALNTLQPVKIYAGNGVTRFQVNRRNNIEYKLHLQSHFNGPNVYDVPVLKILKESGQPLAILFSYACHASILRDYKLSGDYVAFAETELKNLYPDATSFFMQGAGGNLVGNPRGTDAAAKQHGKSLAAAVERVMNEEMRELNPNLATSYAEVNLEPAKPAATKEELQKLISDSLTTPSYTVAKAKANLEKLNRGESFPTTYPYPVQVWKIGNQNVITMGGEPVVEYAFKLKQLFGQKTFVFGYSNNVMAYISTPLILNEGGYEGTSTPFSGSPWAINIEPMIINEILKLAKQVDVPLSIPVGVGHINL
ncbi:MAG: neutral/alkaline non-lysosomal ceramidase N-terminal domain-containing protein [Ginsengibacter sp.]